MFPFCFGIPPGAIVLQNTCAIIFDVVFYKREERILNCTKNFRQTLIVFAFLVFVSVQAVWAAALPSWSDTADKQAIITFVTAVTDKNSPQYIAPIDRIAVFDNDGTIIPEKPYSFIDMFAMLQAKKLHSSEAEWKNDAWAQKLFNCTPAEFDDIRQTMPAEEFGKIFAAGNGGQSQDQVDQALHEYVYTNTMHPKYKKPPAQLLYKPMVELITYLKANGFTVYLSSGSTTDYLRQFSESSAGISKSNVIGWDYRDEVKYDTNGKLYLYKTTDLVAPAPLNEGKPINIYRHVGRRPVFAFGNSSGDLEMLTYTRQNTLPSLCLILNHDDGVREYAYDFGQKVWDAAKAQKWIVVRMKEDFATIY